MHAMGPPPPKFPEKPPLITPSASPPPARMPSRSSDSASPTKRQRLLSTPRRTPSEASTSASRPQLPEDVQKEREASKMRLFDVWSSLAERYTVPVEEDDIINIQTGEITRDNGYLRKSKKVDFGAIATGDTAADDYSDMAEEEEDEYDIDELDAFADDVSEFSNHEGEAQDEEDISEVAAPPPTALSTADAEDLREFLNAERLRKELCGSNIDDDEEEGYSERGTDGARVGDKRFESLDAPGRAMSEEEVEENEEEKEDMVREEEEHAIENIVQESDRPVSLDLISEDELDNWNVDDSSIVYSIVKTEQTSDHGQSDTDSENEIVETSDVNRALPNSKDYVQEKSYAPKTPTKSHTRPHIHKSLNQLYTPPRSKSSSRPPETPSTKVIDLSEEPASPQSLPVSPRTSNARSNNPRNKKHPVSAHKNVQETPIRPVNLTQVAKEKGTRSTSKLSSKTPLKPSINTPNRSSKAQPFVLLTPRQESSSHKAGPRPLVASTSKDTHFRDGMDNHDASNPSKPPKGKGKAAELSRETKRFDTESRYSSSAILKGKMREQRQHNVILPNSESDDSIEHSPTKPPRYGPPKGKPGTSKGFPQATKPHKGKATMHGHERRDDSAPQSSPILKKRKRGPSDANSEFSDQDPPDRKTGSSPLKSDRLPTRPSTSRALTTNHEPRKPKKRSSSRRRHASTESESDGGYDTEFSASASEAGHQYRRSNAPLPASRRPYHQLPYAPSHYPPQDYQPLPDPRAQHIITQAMQQLSALVGTAWAPPHHYRDGSVPNTPHRRHDGRPMTGPFITPTHHPHPYPYAYDPNFSNATLPPESPEYTSSPSKSSSGRRKSLVGRSRSRGRRVSFNLGPEKELGKEEDMDGYSSPPGMRPSKKPPKSERRGGDDSEGEKKSGGQRPKREKTPGRRHKLSDDGESDDEEDRRGRAYSRGQTPGPSIDSSKRR